jgi:hypothetical protein
VANDNDVKAVNLTLARHQLITMPLTWLAIIFVAGWIGKPWIAKTIGFVTVAQAEEQVKGVKAQVEKQGVAIGILGGKVDNLTVEIRMGQAMTLLRNMEKDLAEHNSKPLDTAAWRAGKREHEGKVKLANEYRSCIQNQNMNCNFIRQQLWQ